MENLNLSNKPFKIFHGEKNVVYFYTYVSHAQQINLNTKFPWGKKYVFEMLSDK